MKKFLSIAAVAAMMLAVGCADDLSYNDEGDTEVTFSIALPDSGDDTRAIADGTTATQLYYAVYDNNKNLVQGLTPTTPLTLTNKQYSNLTLRLVKGLTYHIAFWAEPEGDTYYNFDTATATVTVDYGTTAAQKPSNDEKRDAFFGAITPLTVNSTTITGAPISVTLSRPFAQINVGTTAADVAAAEQAGVDITKSKFSFTGVPTKFNLLTGEVDTNPASIVNVDFALAPIPAKMTPKEILTVTVANTETDYHYVAMAYILAPGGNGTATTDVSFTVATDTNDNINTTVIPSASYKRNHRTNILGSIFTAEATFNIVVDPVAPDYATYDPENLPVQP